MNTDFIEKTLKELDNIWYTKSGYQNENLPLAYDDIVKLFIQSLTSTYEQGAKEERKFIGKNKRFWYNRGFRDGQSKEELKIIEEVNNQAKKDEEQRRIIKLIEDKYYGANNPKVSDILKDLEKKKK